MSKYIDLTGQRFGKLVAMQKIDNHKRNDAHAYWLCLCDCGNSTIVSSSHLRCGDTSSCGCLSNGKSYTRLYRIWDGMKQRCYTKSETAYKYYGGRGIKVCETWKNDFQSFHDWALENGYSDELTIDRIDTNGDYEPSNCRWSTRKVQANNTRRNRNLTFNGQSKTIAEWSEETGINQNTILCRIRRNWSVERALTEGCKK